VRKTRDSFWEAELHRFNGELLLAPSGSQEVVDEIRGPAETDLSEAEACFRRAIDIARHQQAKSWELRATTSLVRLLARQGRRNEAGRMLSEIYGWFTEGFDTADLQDAKALLDELS
jgi:predicted ATPase